MITIKNAYSKYKMLAPVLILTSLCAFTITTRIFGKFEINGIDYNYLLTIHHYGAFVVVALNWISFFAFRRYFIYVFSLTLLLGLFGVINFTLAESKWALGFGSHKISFQTTASLVGLLALLLSLKEIIAALDKKEGVTPEQNTLDYQKPSNEEVEKFKEAYLNYPTSDLAELLSDKRYTASAVEAARQILEDRQQNNQ